MKALNTLAADRPVSLGFGVMLTGRIPFGALLAFARHYAIDDPDEFERFVRIVQQLDALQVAEINEAANKKTS